MDRFAKKAPKRSVTINCRITEEEKKNLDLLAEKYDTSITIIIETLLKEELERFKGENKNGK